MKSLLRSALLVLVFSGTVFSQSVIDSLLQRSKTIPPEYTRLIYEYRLPDWGYQQIYLNAYGGMSQFSGEKSSSYNQKYKNMGIRLSPGYEHYFESEDRFLDNRVKCSFRDDLLENENKIEKSHKTDLEWELSLENEYEQYLSDNLFLILSAVNHFSFREFNSETWSESGGEHRDKSIERYYLSEPRLGLGYGYLRKINPILQAIRFSERLNSLSLTTPLNETELAELARHFTRLPSYQTSYLRSTKYFYENLPGSLREKTKALSPWQVFYLDEALHETLGERYEGFQVNSGVTVYYENTTGEYNRPELFLTGIYIDQEFYHNPSPVYQFGLTFYGSMSGAINANTKLKQIGRSEMAVHNLYNLTDKLLVNSKTWYALGFAQTKKTEPDDPTWERVDRYGSALTLSYFIENNLTFRIQANYSRMSANEPYIYFSYEDIRYASDSYGREENWSFSFSLSYYFQRMVL